MSRRKTAERRKLLMAGKRRRLLEKILDGKLAAYSAAAGVVLAGGAAANAAIQTTAANITLNPGQATNIDFDGDAVTDATVSIYGLRYKYSAGTIVKDVQRAMWAGNAAAVLGGTTWNRGFPLARALNYTSTISSGRYFMACLLL